MPSSASTKATGKKPTRSAVGAPSQHNQPSRKGKKAWRKNVDIQEVEAGMEELRKEERATGTYLHKQEDNQLFVVDVQGDDKIRHIVPKFKSSELTSTKILKERSAVPAVFSRPSTSSSKKRKAHLTAEEKERLLRISKRPRKGPLNSLVDPTEFGNGSASLELSEAVKLSGGYDAWAAVPPEEIKDGLETVQPKHIKAPKHSNPRDAIEVPAIVDPHQGTSYNPTPDAHNELLRAAVEAKFERAKDNFVEDVPGVPSGMKVDEPVNDSEEDEETEVVPKSIPQRKTKAQRNKAARLLAEKRALLEKVRRKRELALVQDIRQLRKTANQTKTAREQRQRIREAALKAKLKKDGLAGQKLGKHRVPVGEVDVQLGDDLSESLRGLKPEGNLFRDRFTSLQQRALIEPRVPVMPKRRKHRMVEYEKHAWKRFDREQQ
ncbi:Ribosome biogenesis protein NOP53 [Mycena indigotica]|uniref:Ribosome biogenesis protein NOP53 n=1 Tax=Mycena indigotica TaxID=2126181 RepID=A0A8H6T276_9AGAR|nr:Ribosome biogenesis protein NOP53 [Mycena indigotica]KAF7309510.1 Ribosome biogenesis protein NOP53 [Mycena indigotica]